jgi:predicted nucleotidyltransferase
MDRNEIENIIREQLYAFKPQRIGIFGSFVRNEMTRGSDIDILVSFKDPVSLIQLIRIENSISDRIGIKVDLITENSISNEKLKGLIQKDLQIIYHA